MTRNLEIIWIFYITALSLIFFGWLTGFNFYGSLDLPIHDTYYVIANIHVLIATILLCGLTNLIFYGLKRLAQINFTAFIISITATTLIGITHFTIAYIFITQTDSNVESNPTGLATNMSMTFLFFGLTIMALLRMREMANQKRNTSH